MRPRDREKFVRLANARVNKAIKSVELIGNLSNRSNYSYTDDDVEQIFRALNVALKECREKFKQGDSDKELPFQLEI